jgi:hypothetical protein
MLSVTFFYYYAECHYAECCYAECLYAECHYAKCHSAGIETLKNCANRVSQIKSLPNQQLDLLGVV